MFGGKFRISAHFQLINILIFLLTSVIMIVVLFAVLQNILKKSVSKDYAGLYASNTVRALSSHLNREIALMTKAAYSEEIAEWLADEENPDKKAAALEEMLAVIDVLYSDNIYIGIQKTHHELTVEKNCTIDDVQQFATLSADFYDDAWYFECLASQHDYVLKVDIDKILKRKRVWLNYKVSRNGEPLGVICSGLEFAEVAEELFSEYDDERVRGLIIDGNGAIQMDSLFLGDDDFLYYEVDGGGEVRHHIDEAFSDPILLDAVNSHLKSRDGYFKQADISALIELPTGPYNYATIATIAQTDWSVVTLYNSSSLYSLTNLLPLFIIIPALFMVFALSIGVMCHRLIFKPFEQLTASLTRVRKGGGEIIFGLDRQDEFGDLANTIQDMKERVKAEQEVRRLAAIVSLTDAGIIIKDKDGIITDWNVGAENILGYAPEDVIGKQAEHFSPEEEHAYMRIYQNQLKSGEHIAHAEYVRIHKDGRLIHCSASHTPIFDNYGSFTGSIVVFHDIRDMKAAEQKVQKLAAIIAVADAGIIVKDENGVVQEWNIGAENILGYKPEDIIGHTTKCYAPEETHNGINEIDERLKKGEHIEHVNVVRKHRDGRLIDCSASYTPIFDSNRTFIGSVAIFHDITMEKLLEKKTKSMAAIVSAADAGIIIKDADCNILEWNIGAENILGYTPEEIIGKNTKYYVPEDKLEEVNKIKERLLRGEHTAHIEVVRRHKDGRLIDCSATYTPVFDENGCFSGSVAVFQDISYKKQIESALQEALEKAEEASRAKSIFLANMSHEIRTPLNGIIGFAELAMDETDVTDSIKEYLSKISSSVDHLLYIINDILDISKIEAGQMILEKIPFDLLNIFAECESVSGLRATEKGIVLQVYADPFFSSFGRMLIGDPTKLRQALLNLLSNAIKFTNCGMVELTAIMEEQKNDRVKIRIEVKDSGIGMEPEQIERIFDPFTQADSTTTRKYGGTGLGLTITKSFVEMMGGKLEVESTLGMGSKFGFTLPFETVSKPNDGNRKKEALSVLKKPVFAGEVLVCEDNPVNQEVIKKHLSRVGLTPVIAENGKKGLDAVSNRMRDGNLFDLILMDIHMPVMDGLETMEKLLEIGSKTPVVALTANAMITDKEKYLKCGMSDYLSKPFTGQELCLCLMRHLSPVSLTLSAETGGIVGDTDMQQLVVSDILNEKIGIEIATGDERFYRRLQRNFYRDNQSVIHHLNEAICKNDIKSAHRIAHLLKSSAGMLGAVKLARIAGSVEAALLGGKNNCSPELLESLQSAAVEILAILEHYSAEKEACPEQVEEILNMGSAVALIEKLAPLLKSGDPESVGLADEVRKALSPLGKACESLAIQIEDYDFDEAFETICEIKTLLEAQE